MSFQRPPPIIWLNGEFGELPRGSSFHTHSLNNMDLGSSFLYDDALISILTRCFSTDDCIQTYDYIPHVSSILQLPCLLLFLQLCCVSTEMESGTVYVPSVHHSIYSRNPLTTVMTRTAGLSAFSIFLSLAGIFFSLFMLLTPVIYEKYDKGARLARALKEVRVAFILTGTGVTVSLLISWVMFSPLLPAG